VKILRQRFGERARQEAYGELVQSTFHEAAIQQKLQPAGEPAIEIKEGAETFGYVAEFEVMPEVSVAEMGDATIERPVADVGDVDVETMLEKLRRQRTTWNTVEREVLDGDRVTVSFVGKIDGEAFEGGTAENVPLVIGSGMMIEGLEQGVIGAKVGEQRAVDATFPEDYRVVHLAGKVASFDVTVNQVQEPVLPPLDEDFARALGVEEGSLDSLKDEVRGNMVRELSQKLRALVKERVMALLVEKHEIDVPRVMVESEAQRLKQQAREHMQQAGQQSNVDLPLDLFREDAERRVKLGLIIAEVVKANQLRPDDDRMRKLAEEQASAYEEPDEVVKFYLSDKDARSGLENLALEDAVVDWVLGRVQVKDKSTSFDDVM
jgi:trigger factor